MGGGVGTGGVAWAGAHQGLAVAAGNRAQGVALLEVVHEAHAAAQHGAGAQEVGDHLLPADAAIPVGGGGAPQVGPSPGRPTKQPTGKKILTQLLIWDSRCSRENASLGARQVRRPLPTTCVVLGKSLRPGRLPRKMGIEFLPRPLHIVGVDTN